MRPLAIGPALVGLLLNLLAASASAGALAAQAPPGFRVAVLGDMPYAPLVSPLREPILTAYSAVLDTIAREDVAFVVHVGDFTGAICTDSLFAQRRLEFDAIPHPLVYTFGDNEWTDCARAGDDPLERLAALRRMFTAGDSSLGGRRIALVRQSSRPGHGVYRENVRWTLGGVLFVALHVVGSRDNRGTAATPPAEFVARRAANIAWMREAFDVAADEGHAGVAIFMQANPFERPRPGPAGEPPPPSPYEDLLQELRTRAASFGRPVAVVHGDTHDYRVDFPLRDECGRTITTVVRAETFGSPDFHALMLTVDPASPHVFRFEPLLVRANTIR